ncbi:MAG: gp50 [uncultured marine phage]|uniref:Gp50 n=1 Tax=uncultured marine phage TaxID=707152 RepID=A0A8D9FQ45_9VIRU|nr:MAG: gp50 [uncultured marine phage]
MIKKMKSKYEFFWKNKSPFSQWYGEWMGEEYDASFEVLGTKYPTCEHYMMEQKAYLFDDYDVADQIMESKHPREVKKLGRKVSGFDSQMWEEQCQDIVFEANYAKFSQHKELKELLLSTGDKELVEASPYDRIWGIGFDEKNALKNKDDWGRNLLGKVLMEVREEIRKEQ